MNNSKHINALQDLIDYTRHTANFADPSMKGLEQSVEILETYINTFNQE